MRWEGVSREIRNGKERAQHGALLLLTHIELHPQHQRAVAPASLRVSQSAALPWLQPASLNGNNPTSATPYQHNGDITSEAQVPPLITAALEDKACTL